jgi:hypothetical protein
MKLTNLSDIIALKKSLTDLQSSDEGKVIIDFLETFCGYNQSGYRTDPYEIAYNAGRRDVILTIKTIIDPRVKPEDIVETYKLLGE